MKLSSAFIIIAVVTAFSFGQSDGVAGKGQNIFQAQCVGCHGPDGRAQTEMGKKVQAADLTSSAVQQVSDAQLETFIKDGKAKMPSFDQKLSDDEIRSAIAYIRQLGKSR